MDSIEETRKHNRPLWRHVKRCLVLTLTAPTEVVLTPPGPEGTSSQYKSQCHQRTLEAAVNVHGAQMRSLERAARDHRHLVVDQVDRHR